jgi:hypothetical protein
MNILARPSPATNVYLDSRPLSRAGTLTAVSPPHVSLFRIGIPPC